MKTCIDRPYDQLNFIINCPFSQWSYVRLYSHMIYGVTEDSLPMNYLRRAEVAYDVR